MSNTFRSKVTLEDKLDRIEKLFQAKSRINKRFVGGRISYKDYKHNADSIEAELANY